MAEMKESEFAVPQLYEVGYLLVPSIVEEVLGEEANAVRLAVEAAGGTVVGDGFPTLRALAYPIRKGNREGGTTYNNAYFGFIRFDMLPQNAPALKLAFEKNPSLVRFLIMKTIKELLMPARTHEPRAHVAPHPVEIAPVEHKELTASDEAQIEKGIEELLTETAPTP